MKTSLEREAMKRIVKLMKGLINHDVTIMSSIQEVYDIFQEEGEWS